MFFLSAINAETYPSPRCIITSAALVSIITILFTQQSKPHKNYCHIPCKWQTPVAPLLKHFCAAISLVMWRTQRVLRLIMKSVDRVSGCPTLKSEARSRHEGNRMPCNGITFVYGCANYTAKFLPVANYFYLPTTNSLWRWH